MMVEFAAGSLPALRYTTGEKYEQADFEQGVSGLAGGGGEGIGRVGWCIILLGSVRSCTRILKMCGRSKRVPFRPFEC